MPMRRSPKLFADPLSLIKKVATLILCGLFVLFLLNFFTIRQIKCTYNNVPCSQDISNKLDRYLGESSLLINRKSLLNSLKSTLPVDTSVIGFDFPNTLAVVIVSSNLSYGTKVYLVSSLPTVTMDSANGSTVSANWLKPTVEIEAFLQQENGLNFEIWENGNMIPSATSEAKIFYLFRNKPGKDDLARIFNLIKTTTRYINYLNLYILEDRIFLRQNNQPDIIINVDTDEESLVQALQSFTYLATIKKDARVIDLRFKNPVIR